MRGGTLPREHPNTHQRASPSAEHLNSMHLHDEDCDTFEGVLNRLADL